MPAPTPAVVQHGSPAMLGLLAQRAGMGEDFWRRYQAGMQQQAMLSQQTQAAQQFSLGQQRLNLERQAMALQNAYQPPEMQQPDQRLIAQQQQQRQAQDLIRQMAMRGTIDPSTAQRMELGAITGSPGLASLGLERPGQGVGGLDRHHISQETRFQVEALEAQRRAAVDQAKAYLEMIPGGFHSMNEQERAEYNQIVSEAEQLRQQIAQVYQQGAMRTGAVAGPSPMQTGAAPGGGTAQDDRDPLGIRRGR